MHPQLELLLELQDLKAQKAELEAAEESREIEEEVFQVQPEDAIPRLNEKIVEMEDKLEPEVEQRYRQVSGARPRVVVPVINGVCYGCFMAMPTAVESKNETLSWCENCGSFVYYVD